MKKYVFMISLLLCLCGFSTLFIYAAGGEDPCSAQGIIVKNLSFDDKS